MKGSNDSMMLRGADAPALGVEERSDEAPRAGGAVAPRAPGSGGCGQADPAAVQRRIPVADPRGSRPSQARLPNSGPRNIKALDGSLFLHLDRGNCHARFRSIN